MIPFDTDHDAPEPLGFLLQSTVTQEKLLYFTDTPKLRYRFADVSVIAAECNYDRDTLMQAVESGTTPIEAVARICKSHMGLRSLLQMLGDVNIDVVNSLDIAECYHIVDPATVGQCTGLTAAKSYRGTESWDLMVFEGDIVNCSRGCPHEIYWCAEHGGTYIGGMPCFYLTGLREGYAWTGSEEIVGTIHDGKTKELDHV